MRVKEVADLVGISVRTLHHYDEIGLLVPDQVTESGYRIYSDENLATLQQILFFKELGFPLKKIKEILNSPSFDQYEALKLHREMLIKKRDQLNQMINTVEKTILHLKGEIKMTNEERFEGFDFRKNPYEQEARKRWGDKVVDQSNKNIQSMTEGEQKEFAKSFDIIFRKLAGLRHLPPDSEEAQAAIKEWYEVLNKINHYSLAMFKSLGQMYVDDQRFTKNIDRYGEGLAQFMCEAMAVFADQSK
jgi:DNA-binding transcriptional MerR regulator